MRQAKQKKVIYREDAGKRETHREKKEIASLPIGIYVANVQWN